MVPRRSATAEESVSSARCVKSTGNHTSLYRFRGALFRLFVWHTRARCRRVAARVAADIEDYSRAGVRVLGVVGVGESPSCGVSTTLDLRRSLERRGVSARPHRPQDHQRACRRRVPRGR
jgi:hypothetical protein